MDPRARKFSAPSTKPRPVGSQDRGGTLEDFFNNPFSSPSTSTSHENSLALNKNEDESDSELIRESKGDRKGLRTRKLSQFFASKFQDPPPASQNPLSQSQGPQHLSPFESARNQENSPACHPPRQRKLSGWTVPSVFPLNLRRKSVPTEDKREDLPRERSMTHSTAAEASPSNFHTYLSITGRHRSHTQAFPSGFVPVPVRPAKLEDEDGGAVPVSHTRLPSTPDSTRKDQTRRFTQFGPISGGEELGKRAVGVEVVTEVKTEHTEMFSFQPSRKKERGISHQLTKSTPSASESRTPHRSYTSPLEWEPGHKPTESRFNRFTRVFSESSAGQPSSPSKTPPLKKKLSWFKLEGTGVHLGKSIERQHQESEGPPFRTQELRRPSFPGTKGDGSAKPTRLS